ncbi:TRAP transporter small permease [Mesorhizobium sp. CN2-181]|uniref:TRAP transporter small permease subunit n=1 Tax=Mesorhizobium yinganensis TaxID=3157707 RepID=UPI0032B79D2B
METVDRLVKQVSSLFARLGGAMVVLIAIGISIDVVTRNLSGQTVLNSYEFSTYLFAISISLGLSYTALSGAHIRVDIMLTVFPPALRRLLDFVAFLSLAALAVLLAYLSIRLALTSFSRHTMSSSALAFPLGPPQMAWAIGFAVFALTCVLLTVQHGLHLLNGRSAEADRIGRFGQDEEVAEAVAEARHREA